MEEFRTTNRAITIALNAVNNNNDDINNEENINNVIRSNN